MLKIPICLEVLRQCSYIYLLLKEILKSESQEPPILILSLLVTDIIMDLNMVMGKEGQAKGWVNFLKRLYN